MNEDKDWWESMSREERAQYIKQHPQTRKHNVGRTDDELIEHIKSLMSQETDPQKNQDEITRRREELSLKRKQLEEDPEEIMKTIESQRFKIKDPYLKEKIENETRSFGDPDDDYNFSDMQNDFDIDYAASRAIKLSFNGKEKSEDLDVEILELEPTIFSSMLEDGRSFHDIVDLDLDDVTDMMVGDSGGFVEDVHNSGYYKNPERVASEIVKSKTWREWLQKSKDKFIEDYIKSN